MDPAGLGWSFDRFFEDQYPTLCRALLLLVGDRLEAEDIAQDAMARVYERWARVAAMDSPGGYLYRVALNVQRKRWRRQTRQPIAPTATTGVDPAELVETQMEVTRLLEALPLGQRRALVLVEWLGMDATDAGRVLGIKASSVRVRVHRAKALLQDRFDVDDG